MKAKKTYGKGGKMKKMSKIGQVSKSQADAIHRKAYMETDKALHERSDELKSKGRKGYSETQMAYSAYDAGNKAVKDAKADAAKRLQVPNAQPEKSLKVKAKKKYNRGGKVKKGDPLMEKAKKNYDRLQSADKSVAGRARNSSTNSGSAEQRLVERAGINFKEDSKTGRKLAPRTMMPKGAVPKATALARESRGGQSRKKKMQVPNAKPSKALKRR